MSNKVYSCGFYPSIAGNSNIQSSFRIQDPQRKIYLKSILLTWQIIDPTNTLQIPWRSATDQFLFLVITGASGTERITNSFQNVAGVTADYRGNRIQIHEPGQLFFNSLYFNNEILFSLTSWNNNVMERDHKIYIVAETFNEVIY